VPRAVVIGNLCLDDLVQPDGTRIERALGGSALFGALGLRLVCPDPGVIAIRGQGYPVDAIHRLRDSGIDVTGVASPATPAVHNRIDYTGDGGRRLMRLAGSPHENSPRPEHWPAEWTDVAAVHLAAMPVDVQLDWLPFLDARGIAVSLDPHLQSCAQERDSLRSALGKCDLFVPSDLELGMLFPDTPLEVAAREVSAWCRHVAVIKCGARGVYAPSLDRWLPPCPVDAVVDQTGAGDAYATALVWAWSRSRDLVDSHRHAAVAAALMISGAGGLHTLDISCEAAARRVADFTVALPA
jgi:ribokinase